MKIQFVLLASKIPEIKLKSKSKSLKLVHILALKVLRKTGFKNSYNCAGPKNLLLQVLTCIFVDICPVRDWLL